MGDRGRRRFVVLSAALGAAPRLAFAQRVFRIAILDPGNAPRNERLAHWRDMLGRLRELGYEEGRNLHVGYHWGTGDPRHVKESARNVVAGNPDLIVAAGTPAVRAAMEATRSIPIVFPTAGDPVGSGLVNSLARPGGNVTGQSIIQTDTAAKRIELLLQLAPNARRIAYMGPAANRSVAAVYRSLHEAATARGLELRQLDAGNGADIERMFARLSAQPVDGLILSAILVGHRRLLAALALRHRVPAIHVFMENLDAGGLLTFGPDLRAVYRRLGEFLHRILQGATPSETPVEQVQFFVGVNLRTAKAMGITVPPALLLRADRVIE